MPSVVARIETGSARHYLSQLCRHAIAMTQDDGHRFRRHTLVTDEVDVTIESSETDGVIAFGPWGRCTLHATASTLTAHFDAVDKEKLTRIKSIIGRHLERYAQHEGGAIGLVVLVVLAKVAIVLGSLAFRRHRSGQRH